MKELKLMNLKALLSIFGLLCIFLSILIVIAGCQRTPPEYREFLHLPIDQQRERLQTFPIDKQIDYYLAATSYVHPPELELGDIIASKGKEAVPHLVKRLREEKQEHQQIMLMYIFEHMNRFDYNLKDEGEALKLLKEVTANMENNKAEAERVLRDILENRPVDINKLKEEHPEYFLENQ
jgi:hypothetical protein